MASFFFLFLFFIFVKPHVKTDPAFLLTHPTLPLAPHVSELTAIVINSGEDGAGHYYAYVRRNLDLDEVIVNDQGENDILRRSYNW